MKRLRLLIVLMGLLILAAALPATAQDTDEVQPLSPAPSAENGLLTDETSLLWFVQFSGSPTAAGGDPASLQAERTAFRNEARAAGLQYTQRFDFTTLWNGLSVELSGFRQIETPGKLNSVQAIYPVVTVAMPEDSPSVPDLGTALAMTGADVAQSELGLTGAGVRVAVMDTGVDLDHPDLGGDGVPSGNPGFNSRVVT